MSESANSNPLVFGILDYLSLILVLVISVLIGLYSAFFKKDNTTEAYLFGNRKLKVFPVSLSIVAGGISSISFVSGPTEYYLYGTDFGYIILSMVVTTIYSSLFFLPVFHSLKLSSVYEYLESRFNGTVRTVCSVFFTLNVVLSMPIVMCICSLALSHVWGISFYTSTIIFGSVTTFYTTIGGVRAVIWSDVLQALFIFSGVIALVIKGTIDGGGFGIVWNSNYENGRIVPPTFSLDFREHYSIWSWIIGAPFNWVALTCLNQGYVQRYLSLKSLRDVQICLIVFIAASMVFMSIIIYIGMLMVAMFGDCDPLKSHQVTGRDQFLPLYIMQTLKNSPGVPGLMIAAIVSAAMSTVSTQLNSVAAVVLYDYYKPYINKNVSERTSSIVLKVSVVVLGIIVTGFTFFVRKFGSAMQVQFAFLGTLNGPILGIFIIGLFIPTVKSKATFLGSLAGFALVCWISTGMNLAVASGHFRYKTKQINTYGCETNITTSNSTKIEQDVFELYKISSMWYTLIGAVTTLIVANILNLFMEKNDLSQVDRKLISPFIHRFLPHKPAESQEKEKKLLNSLNEKLEQMNN